VVNKPNFIFMLVLLLLLLLLLLQGVSWSHSCAKWVAVIWDRLLRKARHLGVFEEEVQAARAYDREVVRLQGAKNNGLNFRDSEWGVLQCFRVLKVV
jgi:hypothetical protein